MCSMQSLRKGGLWSCAYKLWGTSKQHMKLQQPRNYDFWVSQFGPPRSQSGNDRETTTKVATTVKRRLLHLAIIEAQMITLTTTAKLQQLRVNSREMTTFAASCNDRKMQRPRSDKLETAQLLPILRKILCRFMAVVVSSAFWKSLIISLENFNLDVSISPEKMGRGGWLARKFHSRSKISFSIEIFNLDRKF